MISADIKNIDPSWEEAENKAQTRDVWKTLLPNMPVGRNKVQDLI